MKRAFLRKVKPVSCSPRATEALAGQPEQTYRGVKRRARTSAAMIGLAISMGTSSLLLPRQNDGAKAAESQPKEATLTSQVTTLSSPGEGESVAATSTSAVKIVEHVVRAGQTLRQIARSYHVNVEVIATANRLLPTSTLKIGQTLRVPVPVDRTASAEAAEAVAGRSTKSSSVPAEPLIALANLSQLPGLNPATAIQSDTSLGMGRDSALSRLRLERDKLKGSLAGLGYGESTGLASSSSKAQAGSANPMEPTVPKVGQPEVDDLTALPLQPGTQAGASSGQIAYRVQPGDTLGKIARTHRVSSSDLLAANALPDPDWIRVSQSLNIPQSHLARPTNPPTTQASPAAANPATADVALKSPDATPATAQSEVTIASALEVYRVSPGDTVAQIARAHNVPLSMLVDTNHLNDPNTIFVGQELRVPPTQSTGLNASAQGTMTSSTVIPASSTAAGYQQAQFVSDTTSSPVGVAAPTVPTQAETSSLDSTVRPGAAALSNANSTEAQITAQKVAVVNPLVAPSPGNPEVPLQPEPEVNPAPSDLAPAPRATPYVENLLAEIRALRARHVRQIATQPALVQRPTVPAPGSMSTAVASSRSEAPANAQFSGDTVRPTVVAARQGQSNLVATAPLGSENYAPLQQPITGRMVSPDLPALANPDSYLPNSGLKGYMWPARGLLSSGFGYRWGRMHKGIDIASDVGTPIYAAADGVIHYSGWNSGGYGNMVEIVHADGSMTRYAHLNRSLVREGQRVEQGQQIAEMGSTGYSTGPHLHFEVHPRGGDAVNPIAFLPRQ